MTIRVDAEPALRDLDRIWQQVVEEKETVICSRVGRKDIAIIAADELASRQETACLLGSPANGIRLLSALQGARVEAAIPMTLRELRQQFGFADGDTAD